MSITPSNSITTLHTILANSTYYDLSHEINPGIPSWPTSEVPIQVSHIITHEKGMFSMDWCNYTY